MASPAAAAPILVTGAAGKTGRAVIARLRARGLAVRALVHRRRQRAELAALGVGEVVEGDLTSSQAVARAAAGVGSVYHICPNVHPDEVGIGRSVVAAGRAAGVRRLVFHSVLHPQIEAMPHHWAKLRVEELLLESGLPCAILQPAPYMQNLLAHWRSIAEHGVLALPYAPEARIAMVDLEDVAEAAVRVLTDPRHLGGTYELCGPDLLDQHEIAAILGRALGRPVRAEAVPLGEWAAGAAAAGLGRYAVDTLSAMFRHYERFGMVGNRRVLEWLLGRPATGFAEFAARISAPATSG
jgi:uncharacterized protein YbjT (DUF2867 family)